jgi:glycolate oxidase FAD binding subunit
VVSDRLRPAGPGDAVGGVPATWVASPADADEVAEVLRLAGRRGLAVVARGAGTKLDWGGAPARVDVLLDTGRLTGVVDHAPGDLVVTVRAGTPLRDVQAALAAAGQRLALDPPSVRDGGAATVGGVLATGEAGPLRLRYGSGRDLLIGVEFVRADGAVAHSGGRVVKNVAGYDLGKLLCGAYGTLGLITTATFRLHPIPSRSAWVCRPARPDEARDLTAAVLASPAVPSAVEVDWPGSDLPGTLGVLLEGSVTGVQARAAEVAGILGRQSSIVDKPPDWWGRYPFAAGDVALKLAVPVTGLAAAVRALTGAAGPAVAVRGSAGTGVVYCALPASLPAAQVATVLTAVREHGFGTVLQAPPSLRDGIDLWGAVPGLELMRRVKEQFDPDRRLAPGRFVGGL